MKLQVAVCDDERLMCQEIGRRIREMRSDYQVDLYESGVKLLPVHKQYDVIFLDIEMPDQDGMEIARRMREDKYRGQIIFLTGYPEFMSEAFKVKAFRFLQKQDFGKGLEEALEDVERELDEERKMVIADYGTEIQIHVSEIRYVEAKRNKTILHLTDSAVETNHTLKYWMGELGTHSFCQVHKSYLVSLRHIRKVDDEKVTFYDTGLEIPVSRRNVTMVKRAFLDYVKEDARYL